MPKGDVTRRIMGSQLSWSQVTGAARGTRRKFCSVRHTAQECMDGVLNMILTDSSRGWSITEILESLELNVSDNTLTKGHVTRGVKLLLDEGKILHVEDTRHPARYMEVEAHIDLLNKKYAKYGGYDGYKEHLKRLERQRKEAEKDVRTARIAELRQEAKGRKEIEESKKKSDIVRKTVCSKLMGRISDDIDANIMCSDLKGLGVSLDSARCMLREIESEMKLDLKCYLATEFLCDYTVEDLVDAIEDRKRRSK